MLYLMNSVFEYINWCFYTLSKMDTEQFIGVYLSFFIIDGPRYILSKIVMLLFDVYKETFDSRRKKNKKVTVVGSDIPFVSILCPGKNEHDSMPKTIDSLLKQDYPNIEIIAIDDGSTDHTWEAIQTFKGHAKVRLFRREDAGGKSSAANMGLSLSVKGDIIVIVDSDSEYEKNAISEIVKPFILDPNVGGVSANLRVRNWDKNLITRFQAVDYLHSISLGRRFTSWIGTLAVCSGAFGAFRRSAIEAVGGWDVGPGEDGDLTLKIRKLGYRIRFAPEAICYTDVPETWGDWWKQRRRWNRGLIRYKMRKHLDMANPCSEHFKISNLLLILDVFYFRIFLCYSFFIYFAGALIFAIEYVPLILMLTFLAYFVSNLLIIGVQLYYSDRVFEDFQILISSLIMYPYRILQRIIRLISLTKELLFRESYTDPYVPKRVGKATIHW